MPSEGDRCRQRNRRSRRRAIGALYTVLLSATVAGVPQQRETPTRLSAGGPVERVLSGQAAHRYVLTLDSNQFVELRLEQRGIDAAVAMFGPGARELGEVDEIGGSVGTERAYLLAEKDGEYIVEVRASNPRAPDGHYAIGIHDLRPAVAADRLRIEAQRLQAEAAGLARPAIAIHSDVRSTSSRRRSRAGATPAIAGKKRRP